MVQMEGVLNEPLSIGESSRRGSTARYGLLSAARVIDALAACGISGFFTTFMLFYILHGDRQGSLYGRQQIATISETGSYPPEQFVFTATLHGLGILTAILFASVRIAFDGKIVRLFDESFSDSKKVSVPFLCLFRYSSAKQMMWVNNALAWIGWLVSFFTVLTGSIPEAAAVFAHTVCAFLLFFFAIVYMVFFYLLISSPLLSSEAGKATITSVSYFHYRQLLGLFMLIPTEIAGLVVAAIVDATCEAKGCLYFVTDIYPALEFLLVGSILVFLDGFRYEIKDVSFVQAQWSQPHTLAQEDIRLQV